MCLALREERRLRILENRMLKEIFGPMRDEVARKWGRLLNEELYDVYVPPYIIELIKSRRMTWAGHIARMGRGE